jgi:enoyl-CoA hydratase/carnithine racemase
MEIPEKYQRYKQLQFSMLDGGVLILALNRPQKKNAIGIEMTFELAEALNVIAQDSAVRVLVMTGTGGNFSTGMDMREFFDESAFDKATLLRAKEVTHHIRAAAVRNLPQPTIALIEGYCLGGAISLVESCDIALCTDDAVFGFPEINFGFFPGGAVAKALMQKMSKRWFSYYALTGQTFNGEQASSAGLVTRALNPSLLVQAGHDLAREIAQKDSVALELTKDAIHHVEAMSWDTVFSFHSAKLVELSQRQAGSSSRASQVRSFLSGETKPGIAAKEK